MTDKKRVDAGRTNPENDFDNPEIANKDVANI